MQDLNTNWMMVDLVSGEMKDLPIRFNTKKVPHTYYLDYYSTRIKRDFSPTLGMSAIIGQMETNNALFLPSEMLEKLSMHYDIPVTTLRTDLKRMVKKKIVLRIAQGVYFVDPHLFTKTNKGAVAQLRANWNVVEKTKLDESVKRVAEENKKLKSALAQEKTLNNYKKIYNEQDNG